MKKITMIAALLGSAYFANAQVGIGTPAPATSAMLEISATNKGVLIPRVALTTNDDQTTVSGPVTSLLVYNTNPSADAVAPEKKVTPGFYYWNVNKWERIVSQTDLTNAIEEANAELDDIISLLQTAYPSNNLDGSTTTGSALGGGMVYTPASGTTPAKIEYVYYNGTSYVKQDLSGMLADIIDPANGSVFYNNIGTETAPEFVFQYWDASLNNGEGGFTTITISDLVQANETKTKIQTIEGKQFYFAENFEGVIPTSIPASLPAGMYLIDVVGGVINNIEEIFTTTTNIVINEGETNEQTFTTVQEYIEYISQNADLKDGVMTFVPGTGTTLPEQLASSSFTYNVTNTNGDTTTVTVNFSDLVKAIESKTTFLEYPANSGKYYYISEAAIQANNNVVPTTPFSDGTSLLEGVVLLDIPGEVAQNFSTFLTEVTNIAGPNNTNLTVEQVIQNLIEEYSDSNLPGTMVYTPGTNLEEASFTYTLADGTQSDPISFSTLVKANESKTGFVTGIDANGGTVIYYVGEDYLSTNEFPTAAVANGWATSPDTKPDTITILDVPTAVSTNFETILDQSTTILVPGSTTEYYTVEQVIQNIANSNGTNVGYTSVAIPADATTGQENVPANSLFYINNEGLKVVLPLGDIVYQGITQLNDTQVNDVKTKLGDKIVTNSSVVTGDTYNGKAVRKGIYSTTIAANAATTSGVTLDVAAGQIISITVKYNGGLVANVTDLTVSGTAVGFNIGTGKMYQVLGSSDITAEVIVEFAVQ